MRRAVTKASVRIIHGLYDSLRFTTDTYRLKKKICSVTGIV